MQKIQSIPAIEEGTIIDHIPSGHSLQLCRILGLDNHCSRVTLGLHLNSARMGKKDVIKVANRQLSPEEASQIALLAPLATITIVSQYAVKQKFRVEPPQQVEGWVLCPNSRCVTNHQPVTTRFKVKTEQGKLRFSCHYCERSYSKVEVKFPA